MGALLCHRVSGRCGRPSTALLGCIFASILQTACESLPAHELVVAIPEEHEWMDCGPIIGAGVDGDWDRYLWGGFGLSVVKRGGVYYLYYQGSRGYDEAEGTPTWRSIGVATSMDGIRFSKHSGNPVVTWSPRQNLEEGAVSTAALVDETDRVVMYYGANTWAGGTLVNADARITISDDGLRFTDAGIALARDDRAIWGAGDELFPVIAIGIGVRRIVYYIPNGTPQGGLLGVAWGDANELSISSATRSGLRPLSVWGPGGAARIGPNTFALFLSSDRARPGASVHVRTISTDEPNRLSGPVFTYGWDDVSVATVLLDEEVGRWLLYYRNSAHDEYGVKVARIRRVGEQAVLAPSCCGAGDSRNAAQCA